VCLAITHLKNHRSPPILDLNSLTFIYYKLVRGISPRTSRSLNQPHPLAHPSPSQTLGTASIAWSMPSARSLGPLKYNTGYCYISFYPEKRSCGKDVGFNLIDCTPDVLPVLSICGKCGEVEQGRGDLVEWSESKLEKRKSGVGGQWVGGPGCRNIRIELKTPL
jgi:hypothetical protein